MADDLAITLGDGSGGSVAMDDVSGRKYQVIKIATGSDDVANWIEAYTSGADDVSNTSNRIPTSARLEAFDGTTWDRIRAGLSAVTSTTTGLLNNIPFGKYNSGGITLTDGQIAPLQLDSSGNLLTSMTLGAGTAYIGKTRITDGTYDVSLFNLTNSKPVPTAIVDASGDQITSFGGGTQYTEGDTDASITGPAMLWKDTSDILRAVSASKPLPVNIISGAGSGGTAMTDDDAFTVASTSITPIGGIYQSSPDSVDDGDAGAFRMTATRELYVAQAGPWNIADISGTISLPTGAATSDKQDTGNTSLSSIDGKITACNTGAVVLAAGSAAIGKLAANSGVDIGDVDVLSLPALPTGSNVIGAVTQSGTWNVTNISGTISLPTGAATESTLSTLDGKVTACNTGAVTISASALPTGAATAANQTTIIGHVDGIETLLGTIDADTSTLAGAVSGTEMQCDVITLPALASGTNTIGNVGNVPITSGGLSIYRSLSVVATGQSVKASAGQLYGYYVFNAATSVRYLKIYNTSSAPTVGTDTPVITIPLPAGAGATVEYSNGIAFATGIGIGATTALADASTDAPAANEVIVNLFYK